MVWLQWLGLDWLLDHVMLGDGQDGGGIVWHWLGAARRGRGDLDIWKERTGWPVDHRRHQRRLLTKAWSAHKRRMALDEGG